jgi:hypothetical protein
MRRFVGWLWDVAAWGLMCVGFTLFFAVLMVLFCWAVGVGLRATGL